VSVLVPNERGLARALELRERLAAGARARPAFDEVNVFLSASETHNRRNVNRSVAESLAELERVLGAARAAGLRCEGVISTSFGCPYEGRVPPERVLDVAARLHDAGAQEVGFGDTTGMANPRQVSAFFARAREALGGEVELTAHFHNTRGAGLANALAALDAGVRSFESSFGELGGCPVPPGATGNVATEDLVSMLHEMGYETGINLLKLIACAARVREVLGRRLGSHTLVAGPVAWDPPTGQASVS
jgi:hydroxymethylglutaryl-CoA lyase